MSSQCYSLNMNRSANGQASSGFVAERAAVSQLLRQFELSRNRLMQLGMTRPVATTAAIKLITKRFGQTSVANDLKPLDLSMRSNKFRSCRPDIATNTSVSCAQSTPPLAEATWHRVSHPSCREDVWLPVQRTSANETKFFPVNARTRKTQKYPWLNALNYIFLQETTVTVTDSVCTAKSPKESPVSRIPILSRPDVSPGVLKPPTMGCSTKSPILVSSSNPFKKVVGSSTHEMGSSSQSKSILAPSKLGANVPSTQKADQFAGVTFGPAHIPAYLRTVNMPGENLPRMPFRLKPPVLAAPASSTATPSITPTATPVTEGVSSLFGGIKRTTPKDSDNTSDSSTECSDRKRARMDDDREAKSEGEKAANEAVDENSGVNGVTSPLASSVVSPSFIFGQNIQKKVSGVSESESTNGGDAAPTTFGAVVGSSNLFKAAAAAVKSTDDGGGSDGGGEDEEKVASPQNATEDGRKSLSESSRELSMKEESLKMRYDEVEVVTGEEMEKNVIQMICKLYWWANGSWQERGRGILRLNDREVRDELRSRIVVRTQGTLTVMLNAKIWSDMSIEKPNEKSVRFTASDPDGQPKIYLVMGSPKDITLLHNSLEYRVAAARSALLDQRERDGSDGEMDTIAPIAV